MSLDDKTNENNENNQVEMYKVNISEVSISVNKNATEDEDLVEKIILKLFNNKIKKKDISKSSIMGAYSNPIKVLKLKTNKLNLIKIFIENLKNNLDDNDKLQLSKEFLKRYDDKHHFFFRLDKNKLARGSFRTSNESDVLWINFKLSWKKTPKTLYLKPEIVKTYLKNLGILI
ncbi:MAG: RNA-binding domain-containing protein [Promethearchaeota archaeon]